MDECLKSGHDFEIHNEDGNDAVYPCVRCKKSALEVLREYEVFAKSAKELNGVIKAGNNLASSAHYVQESFDGVHRLRLALSEWYKVLSNNEESF